MHLQRTPNGCLLLHLLSNGERTSLSCCLLQLGSAAHKGMLYIRQVHLVVTCLYRSLSFWYRSKYIFLSFCTPGHLLRAHPSCSHVRTCRATCLLPVPATYSIFLYKTSFCTLNIFTFYLLRTSLNKVQMGIFCLQRQPVQAYMQVSTPAPVHGSTWNGRMAGIVQSVQASYIAIVQSIASTARLLSFACYLAAAAVLPVLLFNRTLGILYIFIVHLDRYALLAASWHFYRASTSGGYMEVHEV